MKLPTIARREMVAEMYLGLSLALYRSDNSVDAGRQMFIDLGYAKSSFDPNAPSSSNHSNKCSVVRADENLWRILLASAHGRESDDCYVVWRKRFTGFIAQIK